MNFEIYDMLVFEDESGSIYQDCVCSVGLVGGRVETIECNQIKIVLNKDENIDFIEDRFKRRNYYLKEIWTRTDENTYKKVYELVDGKLTKISYSQGMKVYHRRQEVTYDQIKNFVVKDEESMGE